MATVAAHVLLIALHAARAGADDRDAIVLGLRGLQLNDLGRSEAEEEQVEVRVL